MGGVVRSAELRTNISKIICKFTFLRYICTRKQAIREFSSAGSEHLPYKQRVGGSNPSTPTDQVSKKMLIIQHLFCFILHWSNLFGLRQYKTKVDDYRLWLAAGLNSPAASATERACDMKRLANIARSILF